MDNAHSRESTHAIRHNLKAIGRTLESNPSLCEEDELKHCAEKQQQYTFIPEEPYPEDFNTSQRHLEDSIPAGNAAFSPITYRKATQDESVVSSTTDNNRENRSCDSSSQQASSPLRHPDKSHHQQRRHRRQNQITETAAASSTTSFEDDKKRLHLQNTSGRGRKGSAPNEARPPSCGTPLGKIKEEQATSTTTESDPGFEKVPPQKQKSKHNDGEFLKPADPPSQHPGSSSQNFVFGSSQHPESADKQANHLFGSHFPGDSQFRDGRYAFDPHHMPMLTGQGLGGSPILSDIPMIPLSPQPIPGIGGVNPFNPNSSFEFYLGGLTSPTMSMLSQARNLSPRHSTQDLEKMNHPLYGTSSSLAPSLPGSQGHMTSLPGAFPGQGLSPLAYYHFMQQQRLLASSLEKPDELGRFPSPLCRSRARKRPLSISPVFSDNLNITAMTRTSPNSLLPFGGLNRSRSSSVASCGSYGHLAAGGISPTGYLSGYATPMMTSPQHLQLLSRQMSFPGHTGNGLPTNQLAAAMDKNQQGMLNPFYPMGNPSMAFPPQLGLQPPGKNPQNPSHLLPPNRNDNKNLNRTVAEPSSPSVNLSNNNNIGVSPASHVTNDDNEVVYETNCDWENCAMEFDTQEQLVHHINNDHIHGDKKEFVCRWKNCARDQRPFKAQYMLVVHMRRHTGEKPHKCNFKGCSKAYSRLENLKTHLRSHTGEKPYVCEHPACSKAFSNASDRAKHQNRTHSNEKPYACKITGCTKRYTDPSSLRKHVKTVHGPEAHVTKRMKASREREEKKSEMNVKQEPGVDKEKRKQENDNSKQNCQPNMHASGPPSNDMNPPSNMNPRSNQSSYTSGSDVTPHHSPHMTSQNNDSGVDVNVGGNEGDSDGDIVVDENPLPDSTSGGVGLQARRAHIKTSLVPRHVSKKMATLSIGGAPGDRIMGEYPSRTVEGCNLINERLNKHGVLGGGTTEISSSSMKSKLIPMKSNPLINPGSIASRHQMALNNQDRRDSGTVSDVSRKSSMTSQGSRRSSQISNVGINVAGSYDPISLDSSRRSSSNSAVAGQRHSASNSNAPAINPYELHRLRSKFNEMTGLPPPTPVSGESYSKGQMSRWLKEDERNRVPSSQGGNYPHSSSFHPTPPQMGPPHPPDQTVRRRSEGAYMRSIRTPQPADIQSQTARRASDPVRKVSQMDPNNLPVVQRHNSWNNMTPLPGIRGRNSNQGQSNQYPAGNPNLQRQERAGSNRSFFGGENGYQTNGSNMALHQQQSPHQAPFHQQPYQPHGGVNEHVLMDNLNADMMAGTQPGMEEMIKNQPVYGNMTSPRGNSDVIPPHPMPQGGYGSMNTPRSFQNSSNPTNQPMRGHHVINGHYNNANMQMNHDVMYQNAPTNGHVMMQQAAMSQQNIAYNSMAQQYTNYGNCPDMYNHQQMAHYQAGMQRSVMQNHLNSAANQNQTRGNMYQPNPPPQRTPAHPGDASVTPRPPSNSSSSQQNRLRLARLRHANASSGVTSSSSTNNPPAAQQGAGNRVNCTPDAQIPDEFLQQEFIDSIPELQPELIGGANETPSYVKMPADSTTGPDGDIDDDNDDAMSATNTDVTLPPMSAFSSRLATPLMNNPFPPQHPLAGSQRPSSNMAINSMSSMLSTLEEENKYLNMVPPPQ